MIIPNEQVDTREVTTWKGLHLLHYQSSSCSQKVRILLREKALDWTSHDVNISRGEHISPYYLGINPRGVVPALVHDGVVHVESNDIVSYLDTLPSEAPPFVPQDPEQRRFVEESLAREAALHLDLRNITMRFLLPPFAMRKSPATLRRYAEAGRSDPQRAAEVEWWRAFGESGVSLAAAKASVAAHRAVFEDFERRLEKGPWLLGDTLSVLEVSWFIRTKRLALAGYPLEDHPRLQAWHHRLAARPAFAAETKDVLPMRLAVPAYQLYLRGRGHRLADVTKDQAGRRSTAAATDGDH
ncbi:MAG: glutathione S-transferase family protein [Myxococcota bacterium]